MVVIDRSKIPTTIASAYPMLFAKEWLLVLTLIFGGCCSNVFSLEVLTKTHPESGILITFAQFVFLTMEGLVSQTELQNGIPRLKNRQIPLQRWLVMVMLFWGVSVLNNYALGFKIPMTLHIIFRSLSLLVSMLNGYLFFGRKFTLSQIIGVFLVTIGVIIYTFASYGSIGDQNSLLAMKYFQGLAMLVAALILSSFLGQYQQSTYDKYGKHWKEGLFYTHALPLVGFGLFYTDMKTQLQELNASPLISVGETISLGLKTPLLSLLISPLAKLLKDFYLPRMWVFLLLNCVTQCITI